mmetsp:Transcript_117146/g.373101  ORF Transcript_117146/g.373101 Transcript_117146/m.373101 type:complete len:416 (-) Transcript_117146:90-1337(-)
MPRRIDVSVGRRGVGDVVQKAAPDEDLQHVPVLFVAALLASELGHVQAVLVAKRNNALRHLLGLALGHMAGLQQIVQHALIRHVLFAVAEPEEDRDRAFGPQRDQRAHDGDGRLPVLQAMVLLRGDELIIEPLDQRARIRSLSEVLHQQPRQSRPAGVEAEQHVRHGRMDLVNERRQGVGVVEHRPISTKLLLSLEQRLEARHRVRVVGDDLQLLLRRISSLALRAVLLLQLEPRPLPRALWRAVLQDAHLPALLRVHMRLRRAVLALHLNNVHPSRRRKGKPGLAACDLPEDLRHLLGRAVVPPIFQEHLHAPSEAGARARRRRGIHSALASARGASCGCGGGGWSAARLRRERLRRRLHFAQRRRRGRLAGARRGADPLELVRLLARRHRHASPPAGDRRRRHLLGAWRRVPL